MGKKSAHVKTYELRQNNLCIILKQLNPASNENYGKSCINRGNLCVFVYVTNGYNEIIGENV